MTPTSPAARAGWKDAGMNRAPLDDLAERADRVRETLAQIDAGEVEATPTQRAHLAGTLAALEELQDDT